MSDQAKQQPLLKPTRLGRITLPSYSHGEEIFNMVSHIAGGALGIVATVLCVIRGALHQDPFAIISGAIFGFTMIVLYAMSSIYHGLSPRLLAKKVFRILDHCSIYILVAGTYTPFTLVTIREYNRATGWTLFAVIWGLTALGVTLSAIDLKRFRVLEMLLYLGMGWSILLPRRALMANLAPAGFNLLLAGGVAYTVGAVFYGLGASKKYIHSVFHLFVVLGSLLHFLSILLYVM
ncbi:hemolysin III family protein [Oscillospiraceae bacterium HV4-5-C5C]|nr:hemolysin III family protein [Oscillospiraceae bacterium HV4-5-C5C]